MTTNFDQNMSGFFGVEPTANTTPNTDLVPVDDNKDLLKGVSLEDDLAKDYITSRDNFHELIETGKTALDNIVAIASESENPRSFEVAATLLKTVLDANEQLINVHKKVRDIVDYKKVVTPEKSKQTNIQNAVFVGSTSELTKIVKELNEKNIN